MPEEMPRGRKKERLSRVRRSNRPLDAETLQVPGCGLPLKRNIDHPGRERTAAQTKNQDIQVFPFSFGQNFNSAVLAIPNPAQKTQMRRFPADEPTKGNALDLSPDERPEPLNHALRPQTASMVEGGFGAMLYVTLTTSGNS